MLKTTLRVFGSILRNHTSAMLLMICAGLACPAQADLWTWTAAANEEFPSWNNPLNWNPMSVPPSNVVTTDILIPVPTYYISGPDSLGVHSITLVPTSELYGLTINSLTLGAGGFINNSQQAYPSLNISNITLAASTIWSAAAGSLAWYGGTALNTNGHTLAVMGDYYSAINPSIIGAGNLIKTGPGELQLSGSSANTFTGDTTVLQGTLTLSKWDEADEAIYGNLIIGQDIDAPGNAVVRYLASDQIRQSAANTVTIRKSGLLDLNGHNESFGKLILEGGRIIIRGEGMASFYDEVINNGDINVAAGSSVVFFGSLSGSAPITGGGTVYIEGDMMPGNSPALLQFEGDLIFGQAAGLQIEIGGPASGLQHDALRVLGYAELAGHLDIVAIDDFTPLPFQTYRIGEFGEYEGRFDQVVNQTGLPGLIFDVQYGHDSIDLLVSAIPGDANLDGLVSIGDLVILANHFGKTGGATWLEGNFNSDDGDVTIGDLVLMAAHFGQSVQPPASFTVIPEPAALASWALLLALSLGRAPRPARR